VTEPSRARTSPGLLRVYQVLGIVVPLLGALIGGLLAHRSDAAYERDTGKVLSSGTERGDVIAGALSGFMLAVLIAFLVIVVVNLLRKLVLRTRTDR
jgi:zinc transporter ZupT